MNDKRAKNAVHDHILNDLITYFAGTVFHLPEVKLDKLIYIAHLYHYANFGELLTGTRFFSLGFGPHAPVLRLALNALIENKSVYLTEARTSTDPVYSNPCLIIRANEPEDKNLSSHCLVTLEEVNKDWGDKWYELILDYTTRTIPYLSTYYRESIDWTRSSACQGVQHILAYPERALIHDFVENVENPARPFNRGSLSVQEVAEIYVAVCGGSADKMPSRELLGFDLESVLDTLGKYGEKKGSSASKCTDEIDNAVEIAVSLLDSLSFRSYSTRVALKTGMFFLKKSGYSFVGGGLEEHWPEDSSHEILREWFKRVSASVDTR